MSCRAREALLIERYPDGLRLTLACGHALYTTSTVERNRYRCLLCLRRKPRKQ